jgi:hypothetical protein
MSHNQGPIRIVLATDSFLIGDGLASLLVGIADIEVVGRFTCPPPSPSPRDSPPRR